MKRDIFLSSLLFTFILFAFSCKKSNSSSGIAALSIVHSCVGVPTVVLNLSTDTVPYYLNQAILPYAASVEYGVPSGVNPIAIFSSADSSHPLFQGTIDLQPTTVYSLYLVGQYPKIDTLLRVDAIPVHSDSTSGVRFANLSPDSNPISINLLGEDPSQAIFTNLGYKQISSFKDFSFKNEIRDYIFEIRDMASDNLLATFTWTLSPFKNNTIVINGLINGVGDEALGVFSVNNF